MRATGIVPQFECSFLRLFAGCLDHRIGWGETATTVPVFVDSVINGTRVLQKSCPISSINYLIGNLNAKEWRSLELVYASKKLKEQCTSLKQAKKLFGGDAQMAEKLLSRINALEQSQTLKDIVVQQQFRFHKLSNKGGRNLEGYFAIDVKTKVQPWRLILRPLDEDKQPFESCNIDEVAGSVEIVGITEVSKHYE